MPFIIGCVSQKGGVGKSTLARGAAVALTRQGYKVRLADLDTAQGTSVEWYRRRLNNGGDPLESVEYYKTAKEALEKSRDVEVLVVDAQGRSSESTLALAHAAHVVIQPTSGALDDLDPAIRLYYELRRQVPHTKLLLALLKINSENDETMAKEYIQQTGLLSFQNTLPNRMGYQVAQNAGLSIIETAHQSLNLKAQAFLDELFAYISNLYKQGKA
jgi:chromosome partitioning protein